MAQNDLHYILATGTPFEYNKALNELLDGLAKRVAEMRRVGRLSPETLRHLARLFTIKNIYHSNAIEGNLLDLGETRLVVEQGLTITGKSLRDQAEARNLSQALGFLEDLGRSQQPISETDVRQIHALILKGINDQEAGKYRSIIVKISGSKYVPPGPESVAPQMGDFCLWLKDASSSNADSIDPVAIAAAAHAWFVQIHPFVDGNGRTARILMNLLLMRKGYPIAIITKEERTRYYDALEESQVSDLSPLIHLIYESVEDSLEAYEEAAEEQRKKGAWIAEMAQRLAEPELVRRKNEYELWSRAMELLREYFRQIIGDLDNAAGGRYRVYFKDFGELDLEKYLQLRNMQSAKRTWFLRLDFVSANVSARYIFFFGYGSVDIRPTANVTLHVAREEPPGSFTYQALRDLSTSKVPQIVEIGYNAGTERFLSSNGKGRLQEINLEDLVKTFVSDVVEIHFAQK